MECFRRDSCSRGNWLVSHLQELCVHCPFILLFIFWLHEVEAFALLATLIPCPTYPTRGDFGYSATARRIVQESNINNT
jgi:hypothetical protein